jgi:hypothetical protein
MEMFGVQLELEAVREAKHKWDTARRKFDSDVELIMARLLNEAAVNYMSVDQISKASGLTPVKVRALMRKHGLNPKHGKRNLAHTAAQALQENAALLGIEPHEMDLMSPLAYLPMGSDLRQELKNQGCHPYDEACATDNIPCRNHGGQVSGNLRPCQESIPKGSDPEAEHQWELWSAGDADYAGSSAMRRAFIAGYRTRA